MKKPTKAQIAARAKFVARFANAKRAKVARAVQKYKRKGLSDKEKETIYKARDRARKNPREKGFPFIRAALTERVSDLIPRHARSIHFAYDENENAYVSGHKSELKYARRALTIAKREASLNKNPVRVGAKRKPPKRNPSRRLPEPKGFLIRAQAPVRSGYKYYYLHKESFVLDAAHGDRFTKTGGEKRMREIHGALPRVISSITLVKV